MADAYDEVGRRSAEGRPAAVHTSSLQRPDWPSSGPTCYKAERQVSDEVDAVWAARFFGAATAAPGRVVNRSPLGQEPPPGRQLQPAWTQLALAQDVPVQGLPNDTEPPLALSPRLLQRLSEADRAVGRLVGVAMLLPDKALFLYMYVRKEAVLSSQIEGKPRTPGSSGAPRTGSARPGRATPTTCRRRSTKWTRAAALPCAPFRTPVRTRPKKTPPTLAGGGK